MRYLILLATHNGEAFLEEQLKSYLGLRECDHLDVLVSDDSSSDKTRSIIERWAVRWPKGSVKLLNGPRAGFAENFRCLIMNAPSGYDYYAFSDQDDIWLPHKFKIAHDRIAASRPGPTVYCARTEIVDVYGQPIGHSPVMEKEPSFKNALFQSIAGANTMVLNAEAMSLVQRVSKAARFVSHDWWTYIWVSGADGRIIYDVTPSVAYRQHGGNAIGINTGLLAQLTRIRMLFSGRFRKWNDLNFEHIRRNLDHLTDENREIFADIDAARQRSGASMIRQLRRHRIYRQSRLGTVSLFLGAFLRRL